MKKLVQRCVFCLLFTLFGAFIVVPFLDSVSNNANVGRITRGSSISSNDASPYWLSPSGNIAFGFYQMSLDRYVIGIWFVKSSHRTLVWTANRNDLPLDKPCSILFTRDGKLVLRVLPDNQDKLLLPDVAEPVLCAKLHDNGNFVLYGSESLVIWESFDHPTDTILGGQKLKLGVDHLISSSGQYKLSSIRTSYGSGNLGISNVYNSKVEKEIYTMNYVSPRMPATLNLGTTGMLYVVNYDGAILEIIHEDKNQEEEEEEACSNVKEDYIYRATLNSRGKFELYKERIDGNVEESSSTLVLLWPYQLSTSDMIFGIVLVIVYVSASMLMFRLSIWAIGRKGICEEETRRY